MTDSETDSYLARAKAYWRHAPGGGGKVDTSELVRYSDEAFLRTWDEQKRLKRLTYWEDAEFVRYFAGRVRDRDVFSFGCGLGYSELDFLEAGARVTFGDIVPSNVASVERLCALRGYTHRSRFLYMDDSAKTSFGGPYDFIFSDGVLMHMPEEREAAVLKGMFDALRPKGVIWLMVYTPRFVESVGSPLNQVEFGRASDPSVGDLENPWSDWHDDDKLLRLAGPEACILNREEFNEGRYIWYALGRRREHTSTTIRPFVDLPALEAARIVSETRQDRLFAEIPLQQATAWEAIATYRPGDGLNVTTTVNNFHYAVAFPEVVRQSSSSVPDRLIFHACVSRGGFAIGLLNTVTNEFFYTCTIWRTGSIHGSRNLSTVRWPERFQVVVSNYQPGNPGSSEWQLSRIALYQAVIPQERTGS